MSQIDAPIKRNTIRTFALVCVAITSIFICAMIIWSTILMQSSEWCLEAAGAAPGKVRPDYIVQACVSLFTLQLTALAQNMLVYAGVTALCLLTLMVIVVAGGKISFTGPGGTSGSIGSDSAVAQAAQETAAAGQAKADEITEDVRG